MNKNQMVIKYCPKCKTAKEVNKYAVKCLDCESVIEPILEKPKFSTGYCISTVISILLCLSSIIPFIEGKTFQGVAILFTGSFFLVFVLSKFYLSVSKYNLCKKDYHSYLIKYRVTGTIQYPHSHNYRVDNPTNEKDNANTDYKPRCPTCGSTNIKRLSDLNRGVHALAFGLFSKTARSQWVCNNCGTKW